MTDDLSEAWMKACDCCGSETDLRDGDYCNGCLAAGCSADEGCKQPEDAGAR